MSIIIDEPVQKAIKIKGFVISDGNITDENPGPYKYKKQIVYNGENTNGIIGAISDLK